jgi:hypothetical protein
MGIFTKESKNQKAKISFKAHAHMAKSTKVLISVSDPDIDPDPHKSALIFALLDRIRMAFVPRLVCFITHCTYIKNIFHVTIQIFGTAKPNQDPEPHWFGSLDPDPH